MRSLLLNGLSLSALACYAPEGVTGDVSVNSEAAIINMAKTLAKDEALNATLEAFIIAGETVKMGPVQFLELMGAHHLDILQRLPRADGSKEGNNPEYVQVERTNEKGTRNVWVSVYTVLAEQHPIGKRAIDTLSDLNKRKTNKTIPLPEYVRENRKWSARKGAFIGLFKKAGTLYHQIQDIENCPLVVVDFARKETVVNGETVEVLDNLSEPIKLQSEKNRDDVVHLSVDAFNRLKFSEAVKAAGGVDKVTKAHLLATTARDTKKNRKNMFPKLDKNTVEGAANAVWNYLDGEGWDVVRERVNTRSPENDALVYSLYALQSKIGDMIDPLGKTLAAIVDKTERDANEKKAAA